MVLEGAKAKGSQLGCFHLEYGVVYWNCDATWLCDARAISTELRESSCIPCFSRTSWKKVKKKQNNWSLTNNEMNLPLHWNSLTLMKKDSGSFQQHLLFFSKNWLIYLLKSDTEKGKDTQRVTFHLLVQFPHALHLPGLCQSEQPGLESVLCHVLWEFQVPQHWPFQRLSVTHSHKQVEPLFVAGWPPDLRVGTHVGCHMVPLSGCKKQDKRCVLQEGTLE